MPKKNIKNFLGKPLLAWSIEAGRESGVFDRFVLSTEDEEIVNVGKKYGIEVPFARPAEYAQDTSKSFDAVKHAYEWLLGDGFAADIIILLEPTSPGRQPFHIREVAELMQKSDVDSVMGVSALPGHFHPEKVVKILPDKTIVRYASEKLIRESEVRNQDFKEAHFTNSAIYAFRPQNFYKNPPSLWGNKVEGYLMDEKYAFDIDTPYDWEMAELKMRLLLEKP